MFNVQVYDQIFERFYIENKIMPVHQHLVGTCDLPFQMLSVDNVVHT